MRWVVWSGRSLALLLSTCGLIASAEDRPGDADQAEHVVILANSRLEDSVALARYYAERRGIPMGNLIALPFPEEPTIDWRRFVSEVFNPLRARLIDEGWIGAELSASLDTAGRPLIELKGHRIAYLVTCRGVPLRIEDDPELRGMEAAELPPRLQTNRAAVDSELSLLTRSAPPTSGVINNPLYRQKNPSGRRMASVIRVARLDGPDLESCRRLVDGAIAGEIRGLTGRAYLDSGGPHKQGDRWIDAIAERITRLGFDLDRETTSNLWGLTARMDAACLYFGWHSSKVIGPHLNRGFAFTPGAVAVHIYSFSAGNMTRGWVASLVRAGAAATLGNVYEPYLQLTHDLELFFEVIEAGGTVGEAAWYALPGQSWQGVLIGDPLYRPFKVSFEQQWSDRDASGEWSSYLMLRRLNLLQRAGEAREAVALLEERTAGEGVTGLALAYRRAIENRDRLDGPLVAELVAAASGDLRADQWGLALVVSDWLQENGWAAESAVVAERIRQQTEGVEEWQRALAERTMPPGLEADEPRPEG